MSSFVCHSLKCSSNTAPFTLVLNARTLISFFIYPKIMNVFICNAVTEINYLFQQSLSTISAVPFHYLQDLWRWRAFRGDYPNVEDWNDEFWALSESLIGVKAPVERTPEDLDCPSIFHVATDYDMIRYFSRTILQYQFAESLCEAAGHEGPLTDCDFYGSEEAGAKLA